MLRGIRKDLEHLTIRNFIKSVISNYDQKETYIIYDGKKIEVYNMTSFDIKKRYGHFQSYYISKPSLIV